MSWIPSSRLVRRSLVCLPLLAIVATTAFRSAQRQQWYYNGKDARAVHNLLDRVDNWRLPSCASCSDLKAPDLPINPNSSQRDAYVDAAATMAFGAEAYAKVGKEAEAENAARAVHQNLEQADALCGDTPAVDARGMTPATMRIWSCPAPFALDDQ